MFPSFGAWYGVPKLRFATFKVGDREYEILPMLFANLKEGVIPANDAGRYMVTIQECLVTLETLNQATTFVNGLPIYQRYAIFGPLVIEAVSLFDTLGALVKRCDRKGGLASTMNVERRRLLNCLEDDFGANSYARRTRNKVFGHRIPVLGGGKDAVSLDELHAARSLLENPRFMRVVSQLHMLGSDLVEDLFALAAWAIVADGIVVSISSATQETNFDLMQATDTIANNYPTLIFSSQLKKHVVHFGQLQHIDAETGEQMPHLKET